MGTHLAKWFGLSTFDIAIVPVVEAFDLPRAVAKPGPAFAARAMAGEPWGMSGLQLDVIVNPEDITRLVVFDTWTLNCDRHDCESPNKRIPNYDNVFLTSEAVKAGARRLIAMDHGLCFIRSGEDLTKKLAHIDKVRDEHVYGLFPEFRGRLRQAIIDSCVRRLGEMDAATADAMIATVPREWDVSNEARKAWSEFITRRARFVADHIEAWIEAAAPWFGSSGG